jgi:hypothetical protein
MTAYDIIRHHGMSHANPSFIIGCHMPTRVSYIPFGLSLRSRSHSSARRRPGEGRARRSVGAAERSGLATRVKVAGDEGEGGIIPEGREAQRIIHEERVAFGCITPERGGAWVVCITPERGGARGKRSRQASGGAEAAERSAAGGARAPRGIEIKVLRRRIGGGKGGIAALRSGGALARAVSGGAHVHLRQSG